MFYNDATVPTDSLGQCSSLMRWTFVNVAIRALMVYMLYEFLPFMKDDVTHGCLCKCYVRTGGQLISPYNITVKRNPIII